MAYCLQVDETVEASVRRVAHEQLSRAVSRLVHGSENRDDDVHSARKSMKRMRGLVRLVRAPLGKALSGHENDTYRQAAAQLSILRDATVLVSTLESVYEDLPTDLAPSVGAVHAWLIRRQGDAYEAQGPQDETFMEIARGLQVAQARIDDWPLEGCDWPDLAGGIGRVYTRGRAEYDECCWRPSVKSLHDWRKRVKYLTYHTQMLGPIWPGPMRSLEEELGKLGDFLGLDHDCAVLAQVIREQLPAQMLAGDQRQEMIVAIYARRRRVQEECRVLGGKIYAEKPALFLRRLGQYWESWRPHRVVSVHVAESLKVEIDGESAAAGEGSSLIEEPAQHPDSGPSSVTVGEPVSRDLEPVCVVDLPCQTGEGPLWHAEESALYWVDIPRGRLYRYNPATQQNAVVFEREGGAIGGFTIQQDGALLLFMDGGAIGVWREGQDLQLLIDGIEPERDSRFNDVIADPLGRVFCGTMPTADVGGRLYRLDLDGSLTELLDEVGCSNGMGFTPTNDQMYFIDSRTKQVSRFDYDQATGDLRSRAVFADTRDEAGVPDGMTVDAEGCVWCARWDGACLVRYSPTGEQLLRVEFPTQKVSCATFAGPDLEDLYVTTAGGHDRAANGPLAGSLFHLRPGVRGRAEFCSQVEVSL